MTYSKETIALGHNLLRMHKINQDKSQMLRHSSKLLKLDATKLSVVPREEAWWRYSGWRYSSLEGLMLKWNSSTWATWGEELTHWKRPWCWERLKARGEGDNRGWDGWMASPTRWTWGWVSFRSWWWTGKPGMLQSVGLGRSVKHDWATELKWTDLQLILRVAETSVKSHCKTKTCLFWYKATYPKILLKR